jgi:CHAD domain-containing protein
MDVSLSEPGVKLEPNGLVDLGGLEGEPLERRMFVSTYLDTPDRLLVRSGFTLRRRLERGRNDWQLRFPSGDSSCEIEAPGPPGSPPKEMVALLTAPLHGRKLAPVATLRTIRSGVRVELDDGAADVTFDDVALLEGARVTETFGEIEIGRVEGDKRTLERVEKKLERLGAHRTDGRSTIARALRIDEPARQGAETDAGRVAAYATRCYHDLLRADAGIRLGAGIEPVHQFRVSVRRLRALLRAARPMFADEWAEHTRLELGWIGGELGALRDLDVLTGYLAQAAESLEADDRSALEPALAALETDREEARAAAHEALGSERYFVLLAALEPPLPIVEFSVDLKAIASNELRRLRKTMRAAKADGSDAALHDARIKAKRVRYVAETLGSERVVRRAKTFQDVVGEHQDAVVAEERLRALALRVPGAALALGMLVERQRARRETRRGDLPRAWRDLQRAGSEAWS